VVYCVNQNSGDTAEIIKQKRLPPAIQCTNEDSGDTAEIIKQKRL